MPHKIGQARIAVLREAEEDSGVVARNLAGTTGVLEVWESDHKFPGRQGAVFYYPLTFDHEGNGSTARFFRTAYNYRLTDDGKTAIFDKGGRSGTNRFVFDIQGGFKNGEAEAESAHAAVHPGETSSFDVEGSRDR